jgi:AbrB family looped-hinge helix DNA binding protein
MVSCVLLHTPTGERLVHKRPGSAAIPHRRAIPCPGSSKSWKGGDMNAHLVAQRAVEKRWYRAAMGDTFTVTVGHKGRLVIPAPARAHHRWGEGTDLIALDTEGGLILMSREQAEARVARSVAGRDLVGELIEERRAEAARDE